MRSVFHFSRVLTSHPHPPRRYVEQKTVKRGYGFHPAGILIILLSLNLKQISTNHTQMSWQTSRSYHLVLSLLKYVCTVLHPTKNKATSNTLNKWALKHRHISSRAFQPLKSRQRRGARPQPLRCLDINILRVNIRHKYT